MKKRDKNFKEAVSNKPPFTQKDFHDDLIKQINDYNKSEIEYLILKALLIIVPILLALFLDKIIELF